jgi:excinuclease UvrABC helicase subunit UvrB
LFDFFILSETLCKPDAISLIIEEFDPLTGNQVRELKLVKVYANSHYITPKPTIEQAIIKIRKELEVTLKKHKAENKLLEAQRLEERTKFDLEMITQDFYLEEKLENRHLLYLNIFLITL